MSLGAASLSRQDAFRLLDREAPDAGVAPSARFGLAAIRFIRGANLLRMPTPLS
jgi:hypothetical protein